MALKLATPGVYIQEKNAFPNSVAPISTAVPAFIGYTEKTTRDGQSLINKPVRLSSLPEFHDTFGSGFRTTYNLKEGKDILLGDKAYDIAPDGESRFMLYESMRHFFSNGGGTCYIISVGSYYQEVEEKKTTPPKDAKGKATTATTVTKKVNTISKSALEGGIPPLVGEPEPTLLVIPEAVMLEKADCFALQQAMLMHCGFKMRNRFAILDVYDGYQKRTYDDKDVITQFREGVGNNYLNYGASYYPWVYTSIVQKEEVDFRNISNTEFLVKVLNEEVDAAGGDARRAEEVKSEIKKLNASDINAVSLHQTLNTLSPAYKVIMDRVRTQLNILPPSGGMAGVYAAVDNSRGVWKSPANVGFNNVVTPVVNLTNDDQEDLNVTASGKSINAIRSFIGEGTVIWGGRTLDGNSQDWRYINVRRTMLFIEESVRRAAKSYVYEANVANTWVLIRSMISAFLTDVWNQGGLAGLTADQAFNVEVGLGSTMTPNDILDGIMRITVRVAVTRPAEFIVITFQQKMQEG